MSSGILLEKESVVSSYHQHINNGGFSLRLIKRIEIWEASYRESGFRKETLHFLETSTNTMGHEQTNRIPLFAGSEVFFQDLVQYFERWQVPPDSLEEDVLSYTSPSMTDSYGNSKDISPKGFDKAAYLKRREETWKKNKTKNLSDLLIKKVKKEKSVTE